MSVTTQRHHGLEFIIDTSDWSHEDDRAQAQDMLENLVLSWSEEKAKTIHALMLMALEGEIGWDHPVLDEVEEGCSKIASTIFDSWATVPDLGHVCAIAAQ